MTKEEAAKALEEIKYFIENDNASLDCNRAVSGLDFALSALRPVSRERVEKVWRGYWEQGDIYDYGDVCSKCQYDSGRELCKLNFCPHCGDPMTDEAVEMVLERLGMLYDC